MIEFQKKVYNVVKCVPRGRIVTYGAVARAINKPQAVRAVGNALNKNLFKSVPCHRVIRSDGRVGGFARGTKEKIKLLRREGVKISGEKVEPPIILKNP